MRHSWKYSEKDKPKGEGGRRRKGWAQGETTESYIKKQGGGGGADDRTSKCKWEVFKGGNRKACQGKIKVSAQKNRKDRKIRETGRQDKSRMKKCEATKGQQNKDASQMRCFKGYCLRAFESSSFSLSLFSKCLASFCNRKTNETFTI